MSEEGRTVAVCAWCKPQRVIRTRPGPSGVTHGICPDCYTVAAAEAARARENREGDSAT